MKRVILIGDSIRMHYQETVRQELSGLADVWAPAENGESSTKVLRHLKEWVLAREPDIVHINCGLHDLKRKSRTSVPEVPLEQYRINIRRILKQLRTDTSRQVIWAMTTPVNELWHHEHKGFERLETDVQQYNAAAGEIAVELGVVLHDLYNVIMDAGRDKYLMPDGVHYTDEGSLFLGHTVATFIKSYL